MSETNQKDPALRMVEVGAQIVELGQKLREARATRDALNSEISAVENLLNPLVVEHSKLIAELAGLGSLTPQVGIRTAASAPVAPVEPPVDTEAAQHRKALVRAKVQRVLKEATEDGGAIGVVEIAELIKEPTLDVQEALMALKGR